MTWSHPRFANADAAIEDSDGIAAEARAAFERRRDTYPQLVQAGSITVDDARDDLEAWRAIAKDWRWIALGEGEPATSDSLDARIAAIDTAIGRLLDQIDRFGGALSEANAQQAGHLCAMRIWAERERTAPASDHIRWTAALLHDWRRDNGHPTRGAILAARSNERKAA